MCTTSSFSRASISPVSPYHAAAPKRTASCSASKGSRSQTAASSAPSRCLTISACPSAIFPQPMIPTRNFLNSAIYLSLPNLRPLSYAFTSSQFAAMPQTWDTCLKS